MRTSGLRDFRTVNYRLRGFTLIEVLISIAIISVVFAALYSAFFLSHRAVGTVGESLVKLQEARAVVDIMKREIESILYSPDKPYSAFKVNDRDFYGRQASQLSFTAFSPIVPGLAKISYVVEEEGGKMALKKRVESAFSQSDGIRAVELMEDMESFTVEALYNDNWVRTWDSELTKSIPVEVRISVSLTIGERKERVSVSDIARPKIGRTI